MTSAKPQRLLLGRMILALAAAPAIASAQSYVNLDFSQNVQPTDKIYPNNSTLGPYYYSGLTFDFINVAFVDGLAVDARISVTANTAGHDPVGFIPDYNSDPGGPEGDLGVYYRYNDAPRDLSGGVSYTLSFYQGGGGFGIQQTLSAFRLLIYDHDGEPTQSESISAYKADGLTGYRLGNVSGIHTHDEGETVRFDAEGIGKPETTADGGFILYYQNTSSVRLEMFSTTDPALLYENYGIFAAIDGDLSLTGGSTYGFGAFAGVPEPSSALLAAMAVSLTTLRRNRRA